MWGNAADGTCPERLCALLVQLYLAEGRSVSLSLNMPAEWQETPVRFYTGHMVHIGLLNDISHFHDKHAPQSVHKSGLLKVEIRQV